MRCASTRRLARAFWNRHTATRLKSSLQGREDEVRVVYDGHPLKTTYRADFTCYDRNYIVELKAIRSLSKTEWAQAIHYMRATKIRFALLVNFGRAQLQYETFDLERLSTVSEQEINSDLS